MSVFLLIAITHFIALLSPGPDFFLIVTSLLGEGRRAALRVCWGIALGNAIILLFIAYTLHQLGGLDPRILHVVKYCAIGYFLYLALRCFMALKLTQQPILHTAEVKQQQNSAKYIYLGLQSSLFNPKNIIFYSSVMLLVYTQFSLWQQLFMGLWMVMVVALWNQFLLTLLNRRRFFQWLQTKITLIYLLSALCFLSFAISAFFLID